MHIVSSAHAQNHHFLSAAEHVEGDALREPIAWYTDPLKEFFLLVAMETENSYCIDPSSAHANNAHPLFNVEFYIFC